MKFKILFISLIAFIVFCPTAIQAADFYVSPSGSDANPGTITAPFKTVQNSINILQPGDTLFLRAGSYNEKIIFPRSGAPNLPITVTGYSDETAIIDGSGISVNSSEGLVKIMGLGYITVSHLTVQNSGFIGVFASSYYNAFVSAHHLTFSDLRVLNSRDAAIKTVGISYLNINHNYTKASGSSGIGVWRSDHVLVDNNKVINARNLPLAEGGHEECISIAITHDFEVSNNEIYYEDGVTGYLGGAGIDVKESSYTGTVHHNYTHDIIYDGGIYLDAWTAGLNNTPTLHDIKVYNNKTYQTGGISIGSERGGIVENIDIYNNVIIRSSYSGIIIHNAGSSVGGNGLRKNINIFNNTIYQSTGNGGSGIYIATSNIQNIVIRNNVVAFDPKWVGQITLAYPSVLPQITADHNITFGRKLCSLDFPNCYNFSDINSDPQFVDPQNLNLALKPGSPAIDAGVNLGISNDINDQIRPQGPGYDIGAYEFLSPVTPTPSPVIIPTATTKIGDANGDGKVDGIDYIVWLTHYSQYASGPANGDFNSDGTINGIDYVTWLNHYGL